MTIQNCSSIHSRRHFKQTHIKQYFTLYYSDTQAVSILGHFMCGILSVSEFSWSSTANHSTNAEPTSSILWPVSCGNTPGTLDNAVPMDSVPCNSRLCHSSGGYLPSSLQKPRFTPWAVHMGLTKCHQNRFFHFLLSLSFHCWFMFTHASSKGWAMGPSAAVVPYRWGLPTLQ